MANLALALAFVIAYLLAPGGRILRMVVDAPMLQDLPPYQLRLLSAFEDYWIPAVLIYLLLRWVEAGRWLRWRTSIHALLGLGNVLLVVYVAVRTLAPIIPRGPASSVVMSLAPLVIWPAWSMLAIGLGWLAVRSIRQRKEAWQSSPRGFSVGGRIALLAAVAMPCLGAAWMLFLAENSPFRVASEADKAFGDLCASAGEKILETPGNVKSVYVEPNTADFFENIVNGVYDVQGSNALGDTLVFQGRLLYFEQGNFRQGAGIGGKYLKHGFGDGKGEPEEELSSDYGVFQKDASHRADEKRLAVRGKEVTVRNLKTGQTTATLSYFANQRRRMICGTTGDGRFDVRDFIQRALTLTPRFAGGTPQAPAVKP